MASTYRTTIAMDRLHAGWQKNYSNTHRRNTGGVCSQVPSRGALYPIAVKPHWDKLTEGLNGHGCYTLGYALTSPAENSQILSRSFFRWLLVRNNSGVVKLRYQSNHKRFSTQINILVTRSLSQNLLAGHWTLFKVQDAKCMNIMVAKKIKYVQSGNYCAQTSCIVFHSFLFYSTNIVKTLKKPW